MSYTQFQIMPEIIKNGGPISDNQLKAGGTADWYAGCLLRETTSGTVVSAPADLTSDADAIAATGALKYLALKDYDYSVEGSVFVPVQEILTTTVFRGQFCNDATPSGDTYAAQAVIGDQYGLAWDKDLHVWAVNVDETSTKLVEIVGIAPNTHWYKEHTTDQYGIVYFKFIASVLQTAPDAA